MNKKYINILRKIGYDFYPKPLAEIDTECKSNAFFNEDQNEINFFSCSYEKTIKELEKSIEFITKLKENNIPYKLKNKKALKKNLKRVIGLITKLEEL